MAIKKNSRVEFKKPLKVLEVKEGIHVKTVVLEIRYHIEGVLFQDEIEVPARMVKDVTKEVADESYQKHLARRGYW